MHYKHGDARKGQVKRLFNIWRDMLKRCSPNTQPYRRRNYADRGITVCDEWHEYVRFREWALTNGYAAHLSIERKDNDGPYSPENCRWATHKEQCRNRRNTTWIEIDGTRRSLVEWLEMTGVNRSAYHMRVARGWEVKRALGVP